MPYWTSTLVHGLVWSMTILRLETHVQFGIQLWGSVSYSLPPPLGASKLNPELQNPLTTNKTTEVHIPRSPGRPGDQILYGVQYSCNFVTRSAYSRLLAACHTSDTKIWKWRFYFGESVDFFIRQQFLST